MKYSKSTSTNHEDFKLTTDTNVCKVSNWNHSEPLVGLAEEIIKSKKRDQEKNRLLQLKKALLNQTQCAMDIKYHGYSYREASNSKTR